jgi:hypothetical protein
MAEETGKPLTLRTWHFLKPPAAFEIACCACGNMRTQWSEFEGHLWCDVCNIDFKPAHAGVLDGPVPVKLAAMLGLTFDRFNLVTKQVERYNVETLLYDVAPPACDKPYCAEHAFAPRDSDAPSSAM